MRQLSKIEWWSLGGLAAAAAGSGLVLLLGGLWTAPATAPASADKAGAAMRGVAAEVAFQALEKSPAGFSNAWKNTGAPAGAPSLAQLTAQNQALTRENATLKGRLNEVLNWILANFRGKYPLPEPFMDKLRVTPLTEDFLLSDELITFLRVTAEEEVKINDALQASAAILRGMEAAAISVRNSRPDKVVLSIPPFGEEAKTLQEDLYAALAVTLGRDRFDRFMQVSEADLKQSFYHFGDASRTMIFELAYGGTSGVPQLVIRDAWVIPNGEQARTIMAEESTVTNLPSKYRNYLAWLPDYVAAYSTP